MPHFCPANPCPICQPQLAVVPVGFAELMRDASLLAEGERLYGLKRMSDLFSESDFWREQKRVILAVAIPVFRELFMTGAELGAYQRPAGSNKAIGYRVGPGDVTAMPFDFEGIAAGSQAVINEYADVWWARLEQTTREQLRQIIASAEANGFGVRWVADQLEPLFGRDRALLIAESETTNLLGQGAQETYRRAGFPGWVWRTVRDARVDKICDALRRESDPRAGGTPFPMARRFERAHPRCRCWPVPTGDPVAPSGVDFGAAVPLPSLANPLSRR